MNMARNENKELTKWGWAVDDVGARCAPVRRECGRVRARTGPYAYTSPTAKVAKKWQKGGESSKLTKSSGKTGVELGFVQLEGHLR